MVLEFSSHNSEGIVYEMVIDMNFGQPVRGTWWYPLLVQVIVDHDGSPCRGNTLLRSLVTEIKKKDELKLKFVRKIKNKKDKPQIIKQSIRNQGFT